jgi:Tol biopolymer transport system component
VPIRVRCALISLIAIILLSPTVPSSAKDPATPTPSEPVGQIVFSSGRGGNGDIYVVNADGSGLVQLTTDPAEDFDPAWSPDGSMIAFRSTRDGNDEIYVMNADGSGQRNLTNDPAEDWSPDWSPDGTKIAYATFAFGGVFQGAPYTDIATIGIDGTGRTRLTDAHGEYPAWSPDGSQIAFTSGRDGSYDIWVMNADGADQRNLTHHPAYESSAAWSPDGSQIVFDAERNTEADDGEPNVGFDIELFVMNADGSGIEPPTWDATSEDRFPAWGPDGRIAFTRNGMLHIIEPCSETPVSTGVDGQFPDWRPMMAD